MSNNIRINLYREDGRLLCTVYSQILAYSICRDETVISLSPVTFYDEEDVANTVLKLVVSKIDGGLYRFLHIINEKAQHTQYKVKSFELITADLVQQTLVSDLFSGDTP